MILLQFLLIGVILAGAIYYLREYLTNSLLSSSTPYHFYPATPKPPNSATQWQSLIAVLAIGFEVICLLIGSSTKNYIFLWIGPCGAALFACLFFYRQIQEKIAEFQGAATAATAARPAYQTPKNAIEESGLLRLLVLLLSAIAIYSVDISLKCSLGYPSILLLIVGSIWSYQRRQQRQTIPNRIVFFISLAITLGCLVGPFLVQLQQVAEQNRDGLTLFLSAMMLVALQIFRSSALYYRKDLSIAVLRSTLLMGVSAAATQELSFFLFGSIFLALVLPTMVLLYRSALQLPPAKAKVLPWPDLAKIALVTLLLGSILALFAPHFQMSQLGIKLPALEQLAETIPFLDRSAKTEDSATATELVQSADATAAPPNIGGSQLAATETAQLIDLQQDLQQLSTTAPQLSATELATLQGQLTNLQTQLQEPQTSGIPAAAPSDTTIVPNSPSPKSSGQLTEQIKVLQADIHKLQTQPRPSASLAASPNPLVQKLQQQLQATQAKVIKKISQVQRSPSIAPAKPPLTPEEEKKQQEQLTNITRVGVVVFAIAGGLIWYLRQQGIQERKQKAKRRKFDQLPQIEQTYRMMLKELAKGNGFRRPPQTELEFSQLQQLRCSSPIYKLIAEISADYVAWRYGSRAINAAVLAEKFRRFQELYQQELAKKAPIPKKS
jgi:TgpA N-terminal domain